jgi:predicted HTH transcriptional regulator
VTFETFLSRTEETDRVFISSDSPSSFDAFLTACCGMANGAGGWIILTPGPDWREQRLREEAARIGVDGLSFSRFDDSNSSSSKEKRGKTLDESKPPEEGKRSKGKAPKNTPLAVEVRPAWWTSRPVVLSDGRSYRRIEGNDVLSGRSSLFKQAIDALEVSRDDRAAGIAPAAVLESEDAPKFRAAVVKLRPEWERLSGVNFMKRALVLDADGRVTRAGELLLGRSVPLAGCPNVWRACERLLPDITAPLSPACAAAARECFLNALVHADYDEGWIELRIAGGVLTLSNPGLPRDGAYYPRNYRLYRMLTLAGVIRAPGAGRKSGLGIIHSFTPHFQLKRDMLTLSTVAELALESAEDVAARSEEAARYETYRGVQDYGGLPVVWIKKKR